MYLSTWSTVLDPNPDHLQGISIPSFLKIKQVSLDIPFEILGGSLLLTDKYITSTIRYQLAVLLNSINDTLDMMRNVIEHIRIISLLSFKATIKHYGKLYNVSTI